MEPPAARRRRWPWIVLAALAVLALAVRIALPYAIARGAERAARDAVGLPLEIANVDLGVLRGALTLEDVALGRAGAAAREQPWLQLERLGLRLSWPALLGGRIELHEVALERPVLRLRRLADGSLENPVPARPPPDTPPEPEDAGAGWPLAVTALRVTDLELELADPERDAPALGFALDELSLRELALAGEDLTLGGVGIRGPRLRVERSFVFGEPQPQGAPPPAPPPAPPAAAAEQPPTGPGRSYRLESVAIQGADVSLLTESGPLDLGFDFAAQGVSARAGETFPVSLGLRVGGGEVRAEGTTGLSPPFFEGSLRWSALPLPLFVLAARPDLAPWVDSCRADGELRVRVRIAPEGAAEPSAAQVSGSFTVSDLSFGDPEESELEVEWSALEVGVRELEVPLAQSGPIRVALEHVRLRDPQIRYARPTPALDALLGGAPPGAEGPPVDVAAAAAEVTPPAPAPEAPDESAPLELEIDALEVRGGSLRFADRTLDDPYRGALTQLSVDARDVRWPELRAHGVRVRGVAPESAPFSLAGDLDGARGRFDFELQRLDLPPLDPFAAQAGYRFARGEATLRTRLVLDPERYASQNELRLHDLRLDSAEAGAFEQQFGTSLDFALALLRDPSGEIRLPVPVVVERENLRLGLGRVVLGALRAALVGVVSSPLKALGAALPRGGQDDVDLASLPAEPGRADLAADAGERIEALAELLRTRPLLALEIRGRSGAADASALAEQLAIERASAGESLPEVEGAGFFARRRIADALRAEGRGETPELSEEDRALRDRTVAAIEVPPERFAALARARAERLHERLVSDYGAPPDRVAAADRAAEGEPGVAIELVARAGELKGGEAPAAGAP